MRWAQGRQLAKRHARLEGRLSARTVADEVRVGTGIQIALAISNWDAVSRL